MLWAGRPKAGIRFRPQDAFLIPFSLLWGGFALFWETTVLVGGAPIFFGVWGIPFVLLGLYMIAGRFIVDARARSRTYYGLTNRRVILISGTSGRQMKSLLLSAVGDTTVDEHGDGSGTITFGGSPFGGFPIGKFVSPGFSMPGMSQYQVPQFEMIDGVRGVHDAIRQAQHHFDPESRGR